MDNRLMTLPETAQYLSISKWTLYRWVKAKKMPVYKAGGVDRFRKQEIDEWLRQFKQG